MVETAQRRANIRLGVTFVHVDCQRCNFCNVKTAYAIAVYNLGKNNSRLEKTCNTVGY